MKRFSTIPSSGGTATDSDGHEWPEKFDVVVGNPPFQSKLTDAAKAVDQARPKAQPRLPDKQAAYLFLERGLMSLAPGGKLCLLQPLGEQPVHHLTFRRTYSASERIAFEIDHYDWHVISQSQAARNPFVWRVGLLGGGRLRDVSDRIRGLKTLADFVADRKWDFGEGFIVGNRAIEAKFLTHLPLLTTSSFTEDGFDEQQLERVTETHFEGPRNPERFAPPLVLIKEHTSLPIAFWDRSPLAYRDKIVGIHVPPDERNELLAVFETLRSHKRFYQFCCTVNGTQALVGKATAILKQDIDRLPMPDNLSELDLAFWEDALKEHVLRYLADFVRLGQDSDLLKNSANEDDVREYSSLYVWMLGSLYRNLKATDAVRMNGLIAQPFYFGNQPDVSWLGKDCEDALYRLIHDCGRESLRTVRVVRYHDENVILIVKPDRLRYWIRSTAIRDADDTLVDPRQQGW